MKKIYLFIAVALLWAAPACQKEGAEDEITTNIQLNFRANFGDQPLVFNENYRYTEQIDIFFSRLNFYIANITLVGETPIELSEVEWVDFAQAGLNTGSAESGVTMVFKNIPVGDYQGISFGLGVPADLNRDTPDLYAATHPLGQISEYWSGWKSYIFTKAEGRADTDKDGNFDLGFAYHTGSDEAFRIVDLVQNFTLLKEDTGNLKLTVDLEKLLVDGGQPFDIATTPGTHNEDGLETAKLLMDNFSQAFKIE